METMGDDHDIRGVVDGWEGDTSELEPHIEIIRNDLEIDDRLFASKHEAFEAGFSLGQQEAPESMAPDRDSGR